MGLTANELSPSKATGGSNPLASAVADPSAAQLNTAPVAQRIEHLTTDQKVRGSNPFGRAHIQHEHPQSTPTARPKTVSVRTFPVHCEALQRLTHVRTAGLPL